MISTSGNSLPSQPSLSHQASKDLTLMGDSSLKLRIMELYLASEQHGGLFTVRDLQDWATDNNYDKNKVKQLN